MGKTKKIVGRARLLFSSLFVVYHGCLDILDLPEIKMGVGVTLCVVDQSLIEVSMKL